jgi:hypothetical protein
MKKTVKLNVLKDKANELLAANLSIEYKDGIIAMLETALRDADAYRGFMFLGDVDANYPPKPGYTNYVARRYF